MSPIDALAASALARAMQESRWLGPAALAAHLGGVAVLLGTIAVVDLRLLGLWRGL